MKFDFKIAGVFISALAIMSSCSFNQKLPEEWANPKPISSSICPNISGKYKEKGERADKTEVCLSALLFGTERKSNQSFSWNEITHILIKQKDQNSIELVLYKDMKILHSKILVRGNEFKCEDGWVKFESVNTGSSSLVLAITSDIIGFTISDKYLLEKSEGTAFGLLGIIPIIISKTDWSRFESIEDRNDKSKPADNALPP